MQVHLKSGVDSIELTATGDGKTGVSFAVSSEEEEEKEEWRGGPRRPLGVWWANERPWLACHPWISPWCRRLISGTSDLLEGRLASNSHFDRLFT
jgi:hypothetical protein